MQTTLLTVVLTVLVKTAFTSPVDVNNIDLNNIGEVDLSSYLSQEVTKSQLTDIISEIIGLDIVKFVEEGQLAVLELLTIVSKANKGYQEISKVASPEFEDEMGKMAKKAGDRFSKIFLRVTKFVSSSPENASMIIVGKSIKNTIGSLRKLESENGITKEAVGAIIEDFLNTSFMSTIRDEIRYSKVIIEILFIIDEAIVGVNSVIAKEKPEVGQKIQDLVTEIESSVMKTLRPLIELLKPLFLSEVA